LRADIESVGVLPIRVSAPSAFLRQRRRLPNKTSPDGDERLPSKEAEFQPSPLKSLQLHAPQHAIIDRANPETAMQA